MATISLDIPLFRAQCAEYADTTKYPDDLITMYWNQSIMIADDEDYGMVAGSNRQFMLNLLTAHLLFLSASIAKGKNAGVVTSSSVDKVSVTLMQPPVADMFGFWLAKSPRGQEMLMMLEVSTVGGISVGGLPEGNGFRKFGGIF